MKPRIHLLTLAVADLERSLTFYRDGLGLESDGVIGTEFVGDEHTASGAVAMFQLSGGLILAIYARTELAKDAGIELTSGKTAEFAVGHLVATRGGVDAVMAAAEAAGAFVTDRPHDRPWGIYSGYFQDPDGHLWEVAWNPGFDVEFD